MSEALCRCCGIPVMGTRARVRVCPICDQCDGLHGDKLQIALAAGVVNGKVDPGLALTRSIIDDAQLTGRIVYVEDPNGGHSITVPDPAPRWQVICSRALCRNQLPDVTLVLDVILARHLPCQATPDKLEAIARELREALAFMDPGVLSVDVQSERDALDPQHLIVKVTTSTPTMGMQTIGNLPDVEIPPDIMLRARGQA